MVVKKRVGQVGFLVQPQRWIVKRTFGWLEPFSAVEPRLRADDRQREAFIKVAMIHLMIRRLRV